MKKALKRISEFMAVFLASVFALTSLCVLAGAQTISAKLTKTSVTLTAGDTYQLYVNYAVTSISWSSGNSKTASVKNGLVTAKKAGTVVITAKHGSDKLKCTVYVRSAAKEYTFRTEKLFDEHYKKHGSEFGDVTKEQYLELANKLINSRSDSVLRKTSDDGDSLFYDKDRNYFLVLSGDGYIRTLFRPDSGIRYWEKQ